MKCLSRALAGALLLGGAHLATHPLLAHATTAPPLCSARTLRVTASTQRAGGSSFGSVVFTDAASKSCALRGRVGVRLLDSRGHSLPVEYTYRKDDLYGRRTPPIRRASPPLLRRRLCANPLAQLVRSASHRGPRRGCAPKRTGIGDGGSDAHREGRGPVMLVVAYALHGVIGPPELLHF